MPPPELRHPRLLGVISAFDLSGNAMMNRRLSPPSLRHSGPRTVEEADLLADLLLVEEEWRQWRPASYGGHVYATEAIGSNVFIGSLAHRSRIGGRWLLYLTIAITVGVTALTLILMARR